MRSYLKEEDKNQLNSVHVKFIEYNAITKPHSFITPDLGFDRFLESSLSKLFNSRNFDPLHFTHGPQ